jgi:Leucine-rich repeat (LRR) protein
MWHFNNRLSLSDGFESHAFLVSCFRLRSLTYLSLNRNNLTVIPKELCSLEHLSELHLNYNQIVYIPEEIKFLKNLQQLFLVRNNIEELPEVKKKGPLLLFPLLLEKNSFNRLRGSLYHCSIQPAL